MEKKIIKLSRSNIGPEEKKAVLKVLDSNYLGMGPVVKEFEDRISKYLSRKAVCVSTGTSAIHLALQAAGVKSKDEVLVPSLTYVATFQAITACGAIPVACEIEEETLTICIKDLKKKINKRTKAIIPVHYSGEVGKLDVIYSLAKKNKIRVIEDAAHAFGTIYKKKLVGSFGDISCFSFDGIKNITSGEGGCVVTNDKKIIDKIRDSRFLGINKESEKRYLKKKGYDYQVFNQGWRYHMSDIMAAIGIEQLKKINKISKIRKNLSKEYVKILSRNNNFKLLKINYKDVLPHIFVVKIIKKFDRNLLAKKLKEKNIEIGFHWKPAHTLKFFKKFNLNKKLPLTDKMAKQIVSLPLHTKLNKKDIHYVCKELAAAIN